MSPLQNQPSLSALKIDSKAKTSIGKGKPLWVVVGLPLMIVGLILTIWISTGRPIRVEVVTVASFNQKRDTAVLSASGYVTPRRKATVAAKITGSIQEMRVEEGMNVKQGEILARLDDRDARANYRSSKAERAVARSAIPELEVHIRDAEQSLKRASALFQEGVLSQENLDKAQTSLDSLRAKLEMSKEQVKAAEARMKVALREIENCIIRAPFSGVAVSKDAQAGEIVSPMSAGGGYTRTGISTIVDMSSLEIEVDVSESYIARVTLGQEVSATLDAYPDWQIPARVRAVIPSADRQKATVKVRIAFEKLDPKILPDMGVKVSFLSETPSETQTTVQALIPKVTLREINGKNVVFVVKDDKIEKRPIAIRNIVGSNAEVLSGVFPGEKLIISASENLKEGQRVKIKS